MEKHTIEDFYKLLSKSYITSNNQSKGIDSCADAIIHLSSYLVESLEDKGKDALLERKIIQNALAIKEMLKQSKQ